MLLRAFSAQRKTLLPILFLASLVIGTLEGLFILIAKSAVTGARWQTWSIPLLALAVIVTLRTIAQIAAMRLELRGVFGWLGGIRGRLLAAVSERAFPSYRDPWRNAVVTALEDGMEDLAQGIGAGFRCLGAAAHAMVLAPLLFLFSWKLAAGALALALPALLASRFRAGMLAASGRRWSESKAGLSLASESFAEGMEAHAGNGRLPEAARRLGRSLEGHARHARSWETAKAVFPPALEWFFFMALAALALAAGAAGASGTEGRAAGPLGLLPFGALLLLMYRPIREWARAYPIYLLGGEAWKSIRSLQDTLDGFPLRVPRGESSDGSIALEGLGFGYAAGTGMKAAHAVIDGLDLELDPRELTWISGRNGAGKSTLLKLLAGIETPETGRILMPKGWSGTGFAYLPQKAFLEPDWTEWAETYRKEHTAHWKLLDSVLGIEGILARSAPGASGRVPRSPLNGLTPQGLSGGERQRLCLARVFASDAAYLLLDEPTTWLTAGDRERILGDLLAFWRRPDAKGRVRGAALVSHEPFLGEFCSRTVRMEQERVGAAI